MSNLSNLTNIYADLAEGAYRHRPGSLAEKADKFGPLNNQKNKESIYVNYPTALGKNGKDQSTLYLQPDTDTKAPLEDNTTGFDAYFLSDTAKLNKNTQHTYFSIRGSDDVKNAINDWVFNDSAFALLDSKTPLRFLSI